MGREGTGVPKKYRQLESAAEKMDALFLAAGKCKPGVEACRDKGAAQFLATAGVPSLSSESIGPGGAKLIQPLGKKAAEREHGDEVAGLGLPLPLRSKGRGLG